MRHVLLATRSPPRLYLLDFVSCRRQNVSQLNSYSMPLLCRRKTYSDDAAERLLRRVFALPLVRLELDCSWLA